MAATFSYQDHHDQSAAIEMLAGLLAEKSGKAGLMASDEEKRRKERAQRAISLNVVTALLAVLKVNQGLTPPIADCTNCVTKLIS